MMFAFHSECLLSFRRFAVQNVLLARAIKPKATVYFDSVLRNWIMIQ